MIQVGHPPGAFKVGGWEAFFRGALLEGKI